MVPLSEYATVSEDATLRDAVVSLETAQKKYILNQYTHKAILVYGKDGKIIGKISPLDIIRALEPKYRQIGHSDPLSTIGLSRFGLSSGFLKSLVEQYHLWDEPFEKIVAESASKPVKEFMYTPSEGEFVKIDAPLSQAINQIIMGHHQSLLVLQGEEIVGILRLVDIFKKVCDYL
ncbi:MAG: CBS domain-containing protein [Candidatus Magnetomorum sp.]|nr:CBS domain-containing protein [Candidatus Magnetomorum sp.]